MKVGGKSYYRGTINVFPVACAFRGRICISALGFRNRFAMRTCIIVHHFFRERTVGSSLLERYGNCFLSANEKRQNCIYLPITCQVFHVELIPLWDAVDREESLNFQWCPNHRGLFTFISRCFPWKFTQPSCETTPSRRRSEKVDISVDQWRDPRMLKCDSVVSHLIFLKEPLFEKDYQKAFKNFKVQ